MHDGCADEYRNTGGPLARALGSSGQPSLVLQTFGDHLRDPVASADPQKVTQRRKQMMFELNRSGQYLQLQEQLRASVVHIVQEHFHKAGTMDRQDMQVRAVPCRLWQAEVIAKLFRIANSAGQP